MTETMVPNVQFGCGEFCTIRRHFAPKNPEQVLSAVLNGILEAASKGLGNELLVVFNDIDPDICRNVAEHIRTLGGSDYDVSFDAEDIGRIIIVKEKKSTWRTLVAKLPRQ